MVVKTLIIISCCLYINGCASYTQLNEDMRIDFYRSDYENSNKELESLDLAESQTDKLLYHLEKSSIETRLNHAKHTKSARYHLDAASRLVDASYTTSFSQTSASFFINDSVQRYDGEDYEQVALHTMAALSWLQDQKLSNARVEAKRSNARLRFFKSQDHTYQNDGFSWLLSGFIFEANKDDDDAIIDYKRALDAYQGAYKRFAPRGVPQVLIDSLHALAKKKNRTDILKILKPYTAKSSQHKSSVIVIQERGHIGIKKAKDFFISVDNKLVRFSFPYIAQPHWSFIPHTSITWDKKRFHSEPLVDFNALAHYSLEDRRGRLMAKGLARIITKSAIVREAGEKLGPLGEVLANIVTVMTESADTRSWTLLPRYFYATRIWLPPGRHTLVLDSKKTESIQIKENQTLFLRDWS